MLIPFTRQGTSPILTSITSSLAPSSSLHFSTTTSVNELVLNISFDLPTVNEVVLHIQHDLHHIPPSYSCN